MTIKPNTHTFAVLGVYLAAFGAIAAVPILLGAPAGIWFKTMTAVAVITGVGVALNFVATLGSVLIRSRQPSSASSSAAH